MTTSSWELLDLNSSGVPDLTICTSIPVDLEIDKATEKERAEEHLRSLRKGSRGFFDAMNQQEPSPIIDFEKMSRKDALNYIKTRRDLTTATWLKKVDEDIKASRDANKKLVKKQLEAAKLRGKIGKEEMKKYLQDNPLDEKSFKLDIKKCSSICVFSFGHAKLESSKYKNFIRSLKKDNSYRVYFGPKLSNFVGMATKEEFNPKLKPDHPDYETLELLPGLHEVGTMLGSYEDAAVLLSDKTKDEVLRKIGEYIEYDYLKPGQTPIEPLAFKKNEFLALHPRTNAMNLCAKLKKLGMPVEISGGRIKLTKAFNVCENGVRVAKGATNILRLLKKEMFKYVLMPLCCWSASTGETEYFDLNLPKSR